MKAPKAMAIVWNNHSVGWTNEPITSRGIPGEENEIDHRTRKPLSRAVRVKRESSYTAATSTGEIFHIPKPSDYQLDLARIASKRDIEQMFAVFRRLLREDKLYVGSELHLLYPDRPSLGQAKFIVATRHAAYQLSRTITQEALGKIYSEPIKRAAQDRGCDFLLWADMPQSRIREGAFGGEYNSDERLSVSYLRKFIVTTQVNLPGFVCPNCNWFFDDAEWLSRLRTYQSQLTGLPINEVAHWRHAKKLIDAGCTRPKEFYDEHPMTQGSRHHPRMFRCKKGCEPVPPYLPVLQRALREANFRVELLDSRKAMDDFRKLVSKTDSKVQAGDIA